MTIRQKGRVLSLAAIALLLIWAVWQYGNDIRKMTAPIENVTDCYVDGTDFSPIMNLLVDSTNGFLSAVMIVLNVVAMCVFSLILLVPWRLIAVRKLSVIDETEVKIAEITMLCAAVLSVIMGFVGTGFTHIIYVLILSIETCGLFFLLGVLPLKRRNNKAKEQKN